MNLCGIQKKLYAKLRYYDNPVMLECKIEEVSVTQMGFAILVRPLRQDKIIPIFVASTEAHAISSFIRKDTAERPATHDMTSSIIKAAGIQLEKVFINDFKSGVFYAKLYFSGPSFQKQPFELDVRPSDAIALALSLRAPVFVAEHVYDQTAISGKTLKTGTSGNFDVLSDPISDEILTDDEKEEFLQAILEEFGKGGFVVKEDKSSEKVFQSRRQVLEQMLKTALAKENYEEAARLRDKIEGGD